MIELEHTTFAGPVTPVLRRELFIQRDAVAVLPFDPRARTVMLVEQFRTGLLDRDGRPPWLAEICAGLIDPGETPEATARRELREECGLEAEALVEVAAYHPSPGSTTERTTVFIGLCRLPEHGGLHGHAAEGEDIRTLVLPVDEALAMAQDGRIQAASALVAILWLGLNRDRLRPDGAPRER